MYVWLICYWSRMIKSSQALLFVMCKSDLHPTNVTKKAQYASLSLFWHLRPQGKPVACACLAHSQELQLWGDPSAGLCELQNYHKVCKNFLYVIMLQSVSAQHWNWLLKADQVILRAAISKKVPSIRRKFKAKENRGWAFNCWSTGIFLSVDFHSLQNSKKSPAFTSKSLYFNCLGPFSSQTEIFSFQFTLWNYILAWYKTTLNYQLESIHFDLLWYDSSFFSPLHHLFNQCIRYWSCPQHVNIEVVMARRSESQKKLFFPEDFQHGLRKKSLQNISLAHFIRFLRNLNFIMQLSPDNCC